MHTLESLEQRVSALEARFHLKDELEVIAKTHLDERFDRVERSLKDIKDAGWKLLWAIILGAVGIILTYAFRGGFYIP